MDFRKSLRDSQVFSVTWELVPGRGAQEKAQEKIFEDAQLANKDDRIHGLTITDNPGGNPAISADYLGLELAKLGVEPVVHFTCKDKNRNQMESSLYALARGEVNNLLVMTGDYPVSGYQGRPKPVFDLDPTHVISMIKQMNQGYEVPTPRGTVTLHPTQFFAGVAVSPFKNQEAEVLTQYYKLGKKVGAGADFIVSQLGYDARKFHELLLFTQQAGWDVPIIGNIYMVNYGVAKLMHENKLPGCLVTDEFLARLAVEKTDGDKGKGARILRAAKMYAFMKGMGFAGAHIGGPGMEYTDLVEIIEQGEALTSNWPRYAREISYGQEDGFYYFQYDQETGLNKPQVCSSKYNSHKGWDNRFFRVLHHTLFEERGIMHQPMTIASKTIQELGLEDSYATLEHIIKMLSNNCQQCGDCALVELAYYCPMSQCAKNQRNGPCGGSVDGWCEVYIGKKQCLYVRAYTRLKPYGEEASLRLDQIPPCNWELHHTSSWLNYYLGKDHVPNTKSVE